LSAAAAAVLATGVFGVAAAGAAPLGTITEFTAAGTNPAQIKPGPDGNLWFTDRSGTIGMVDPATDAISEFKTGLNAGSMPFSIVAGPDGNMWFTDQGTTSAIGMINPTTHAITEFSTGLNPGSKPYGIALGPDGNLWFTDDSTTTPAIGMINPTTHVISEFSSGLNVGSAPQQGIVAGPDGNIWFTDKGTTKAIGMINPTTHVITEFSSGLNAGSAPGAAIAVGTDENLYFVDPGTHGAIGMINPTTDAITEYSIGAGSAPGRIAAGPDGNLWFTDKGSTPAIGMINPTTHAITEYSSGLNAGSLPGGIGVGPDGNMWFTDQGTIRAIGQIVTGSAAASITPPSVTGSGELGTPQSCGGDAWSTWAGWQPSPSANGLDGYQWLLDGSPISGATGPTYTPAVTSANLGQQLSCEATVTYTLFPITVSATSSAITLTTAPTSLYARPQLVFFEPFRRFGDQIVEATLTSSGSPLAGQTISFSDGSTALCSGVTDFEGVARCRVSWQDEQLLIHDEQYTASFAGTTLYSASSATVPVIPFFRRFPGFHHHRRH
jgi:streptogramin lyase